MIGVGIDMGDIDAGRGEIGVQTAAEVIAARLAAEGRLRAGAGGGHRLVAALATAFVMPGGARQRLVALRQAGRLHHDVEMQAADHGNVDHAAP